MRFNSYGRKLLGLATCALLALVFGLAAGDARAERPSSIKELDQEVRDALASVGYNNVNYVVLVQPGDRFVVLVPDPPKGEEYDLPENAEIRIPASGSLQNKNFQEAIIIRKSSPATVVVCERIGGQKVCWEEQR